MKNPQASLLRMAFLAGAITDGVAILPLLSSSLANILWGFHDESGAYQFAMRYAASLMLGWTALLVWASRRPVERRFVAALTVLVICGLVLTEIVGVLSGSFTWKQMLPTWCVQAILLGLFVAALRQRPAEASLPFQAGANQ